MGNIITPVLPHDLPENWNDTQYVSPGGTEVGLTEKHGYNYLMKQVNNSQKAINELDAELENIDTTLQNKAPAGYGLGEKAKSIDSWDDALVNGWYMAPAPSGIGSGNIWGRVDCLSNGYLVQTVYADNYKNSAIRFRIGSVFSDWEWVNPTMIPNTEYRTTERINGKAVYKKNVNGVIQYRLDGETKWMPYVNVTGGDYRVSGTQELWVSNSGSDTTGDGSQSNPFATIQHAVDFASKNLSGQGLYIKLNPGTYNENVNIYGFYGTRGWAAMKIIGGSSIEEAENYKVSSITVEGSISGTVNIEGINFTTSKTDVPCITSRGACLSIYQCISEAGANRFFSIDSCELGWAVISTCRVSNIKETVIQSSGVSVVTVRWCSGSNNAALYKTYYGGIIKLVGECYWTGTKTWVNEAGGNALATGAGWIFTATIPASGWTANGVGVKQTLAVSGIRSEDNPIVTDVITNDQATNMAIKEAWNLVSYIMCGDNSITIYCDQGTPEVNIPIQIQCVR